jgi:hypothetical protein
VARAALTGNATSSKRSLESSLALLALLLYANCDIFGEPYSIEMDEV